MSTTTPHTPLPKQPLGRTFLVAVSLLGLFAAVQLLAVVLHYIPMLRQQIATTAVPVQPAATPQPVATPASQQQGQARAQGRISPADVQKAQQLIIEANRKMRVEGEFDAALLLLEQAEALLPGDPTILIGKSQIFERLNQPGEAVSALKEALNYPGLPSQIRAEAERKMAQLIAMIGPEGVAAAPMMDGGIEESLRQNGVPPGSSLGIVEVRLRDTKVGEKGLRVAVKSLPGSNISGKDVKILVYFYEQTEDGEVQLTESPVSSQWQSPPIDWAADEPELVEMQYKMPMADPMGASERKYFGYVVGIYYQGELQDFRSEPAKLARDFPLPLDLKQNPQ